MLEGKCLLNNTNVIFQVKKTIFSSKMIVTENYSTLIGHWWNEQITGNVRMMGAVQK